MSVTKPAPAAGDPCPNCGGELVAARVPTDAEYSAATAKENPAAWPHGADTATPEKRAELGALHQCATCGYRTRIGATLDEQVDARDGAKPKRNARATGAGAQA